jgi:hypothetical protein
MRSERGEHRHHHVALVATATDAAAVASPADHHGASAVAASGFPTRGHPAGWSLLRMSVPARLIMVAAAALLLWIAVAWALA